MRYEASAIARSSFTAVDNNSALNWPVQGLAAFSANVQQIISLMLLLGLQ